jgi:hypothetical protein
MFAAAQSNYSSAFAIREIGSKRDQVEQRRKAVERARRHAIIEQHLDELEETIF